MNGDFSKTTFDERKHYTGVLLQQGRVQLDADWNEAESIEANRGERALRDLIGRGGSPNNGFKIAARWTLDDMESAAGWQATGKKARLSVDYVDYLRGVGSLRVSGASEIRKTLTEAIDLSNPEANLTFTVKSSRPGGAPDKTGFTFFIADGEGYKAAWDVSGLTPQTVGVWQVYTCSLASAVKEAKLKLHDVKTIGFTDLKPDRVYHFDSIQRDFAQIKLNPAGDFYILGGEAGDPGRLYVDGLACQKEVAETYSNQRDYPEALPLKPEDKRVDLVYLDVWQRHVTYIEDPTLREAALGGLDTCTRVQTVAQVKVLPGVVDVSGQRLDSANLPDDLNKKFATLKATGQGTLSTLVTAPAQSADPCQIAPEADFLGFDNRLYRVEIHEPGPLGQATFKWSKDNGSIAVAIVEDVVIAQGPEAQTVKVEHLGRDRATGIAVSDWVEIADDLSDLSDSDYDAAGIPMRRTGELRQVKAVDPDANTLTLYSPLNRAYTVARHARVRKWDGAGRLTAAFVDTAQTPQLDFGDGVRVSFDGTQPMQTGDYWQFTARGATGQVEKLERARPAGVVHHYCPLALIKWQKVGDRFEITDLADCRNHFPALAELRATEVDYDDGAAGLTEDVATLAKWRGDAVDDPQSAVVEGKIANVQQALDLMSERANKFLTLRYISGDGQEGLPGDTLLADLIVAVDNLLGEPQAGIPVKFEVQGDRQGSVEPSSALTDSRGRARTQWTLSAEGGLNKVKASLVTPQAGTLEILFNARGLCADKICFEGEGEVDTVQAALERLEAIKVNRAGDTLTGPLTVAGKIESNSGGFKFPDGSLQITAAPADGIPSGYFVLHESPTAPRGYLSTGMSVTTSGSALQWIARAALPATRWLHAVGVVNDSLYVIGGCTQPGNFASEVEAYDPLMDAWTHRADLPHPRLNLAVGVVNGKLYAIGGIAPTASGVITADYNEEYNPATDTWRPRTPLPTPRAYHAIGVINGKLYVIGGRGPSGALDTNEEYDPATDTWQTKAPLPTPRACHAIGMVNGKLYVIGGSGPWGTLDTNEEYDPATDTWQTKTPVPMGRYLHAIGVVHNRVYVIGGWGHFDHKSEAYDPATDTWSDRMEAPLARAYHAVGVIGDRLYAVGGTVIGSGAGSQANEVLVLSPDSLYVYLKN